MNNLHAMGSNLSMTNQLMKRILLALAIVTLVLPALRQAEARTDVSIDFFYNNLGSGSWVELGNYGYCWQPTVAVSNRHWRPYADGYWAYTDVGWTWVSYEDFGWATYHYGRWTRTRDRGWFWIPGREWGPAWVSWRTGGDYVGWAPLPPSGGGEVVYEGRAITGAVDVEFDIGPSYYNFVDIRYIGEPVLRERIFAPEQNYGYINQTVNVTNITYNNSTVYNYGPDYNTMSQYSTRPIQRLTLQRQLSGDLSAAAQSGAMTRVQGNQLMVAAPMQFEKAAAAVAPKTVKEKIEQPTIEHGWAGMDDPKEQAKLKSKMKAENSKEVPPPTMKPNPAAAAVAGETNNPPGARADDTGAAAMPVNPAVDGKGKGKDARGAMPAVAASPGIPVNPPAAVDKGRGEAIPPVAPGKGRGKDKRQLPPAAAPQAIESGEEAPAVPPVAQPERGKPGKKQPQAFEGGPVSSGRPEAMRSEPSSGSSMVAPAIKPEGKHNRPERAHVEDAPNPQSAAPMDAGRGKHQGEAQRKAAPAPPAEVERVKPEAPPQAAQPRFERMPPERVAPPAGRPAGNPAAAPAEGGRGTHEEAKPEKKKKGEPDDPNAPQQ